MNDTQLETIKQIEVFLLGSQTIELVIEDKAYHYVRIQRAMVQEPEGC